MLRGCCVTKCLLTLPPCSIRLMWHHTFKGTVNEERNADDSSLFPLTWTCNWPGRVVNNDEGSNVKAPGLRRKVSGTSREKHGLGILPELVRNTDGVA